MAGELRLGLIGAGRWGRNYIKTIAGLEGVRLARLASRNPSSPQLVAGDCAIEDDWRAMLGRGDLDAVIVATPPALHAAMVQAAVERALPVLVEKPLTLDLREAEALRAFAGARGGFVMVDHTHLYHPAYRALKHAAPGFGAIRALHCFSGNFGPFRADAPVLWDWGAHDVAICLDLLGSAPVELHARCLEARRTPEGLGQVLELRASFPPAVPAILRFGNIVPKTRRLVVNLERAVLVYDDMAQHKFLAHPPSGPEEPPRGPGEPLPYEARLPLDCVVSEFASAVRAGNRPPRDLDLGVEVVRVLERCQEDLARA